MIIIILLYIIIAWLTFYDLDNIVKDLEGKPVATKWLCSALWPVTYIVYLFITVISLFKEPHH